MLRALVVISGTILIASTCYAAALGLPADRNKDRMESLAGEVRHQLVMLPYYSVFDWLQAKVDLDGTVTLMGEVTRPSLKDDAESRVEKLEGATHVVNRIETLPLSTMDDELRISLYRAIYSFDSPLFRYATQSLPTIHIIVKNGQVELKGVVAGQEDSDLAYLTANQVPGVFSVKNELKIEGRVNKPIS